MLCIENLSYKNILHNISVEFNEGEICVILGDTGSGKTILLKIIAVSAVIEFFQVSF